MQNQKAIPFERLKAFAITGLALAVISQPLFAQARVDLRGQQTRIKDQYQRNTCNYFCTVAAMEAAYRRAGHGVLDLSEEFFVYMSKMFWLEKSKAPPLASQRENQPSWADGGSGRDMLGVLAGGLRVPKERYMPYVTGDDGSGYTLPVSSNNTTYWNSQKRVTDWALDPKNLPRIALNVGRYYGVKSFAAVKANDPAAIENILRQGKEVVWDFEPKGNIKTHVRYARGGTNEHPAIWQPVISQPARAHCMLIIGYDRTHKDSSRHYFICKNQWANQGRSKDGFTYVSYAYLKAYGRSGHYITAVTEPQGWPELAFIGRWNLCFDGHTGTLDVYHLPGIHQWRLDRDKTGQKDLRVGIFTDRKTGTVHRVNGTVGGGRLSFWFKTKKPNMAWGELRQQHVLGRRFVYRMIDPFAGRMAGWHYDNAGSLANPAWGGYARVPSTAHGRDGFLKPSFNDNLPWTPEMYLGLWTAALQDATGKGMEVKLSFQRRNDMLVPLSMRATHFGLQGEYIDKRGGRQIMTALVLKSRVADITVRFTDRRLGAMMLHGYMLSHQRGVFAGDARMGADIGAFYAYRTEGASNPGVALMFGTGCRGMNGVLTQKATGPFIGQSYTINVTGGSSGGAGSMMIGLTDKTWNGQNLPLDLGSLLGAPGCKLYIAPTKAIAVPFDLTGRFKLTTLVPNDRNLIGNVFFTQFAGFDVRVKGGVFTSNAARLRVGGWK